MIFLKKWLLIPFGYIIFILMQKAEGSYFEHSYDYHKEEIETIYQKAKISLEKSLIHYFWGYDQMHFSHIGRPWPQWYFYEDHSCTSFPYAISYKSYKGKYDYLFCLCDKNYKDSIQRDAKELQEKSELFEKYYTNCTSNYGTYLKEKINELQQRLAEKQQGWPIAQEALHQGWAEVQKSLLELHSQCIALNHTGALDIAYYERGNIYFDEGKTEEFLLDIVSLIELNSDISDFSSNGCLEGAKNYNDLHCYDEAIEILSQFIKKNPHNKEAYFQRAMAYFEKGNFDCALKDYLESDIHPSSLEQNDPYSLSYLEFSKGIGLGALKGSVDSTVDFVPSMLSTFGGLGSTLWAIVSNPIGISQEFAAAAKACLEFINNNTVLENITLIVPELKECLTTWNELEDEKKGYYCGYIIGKYGVDILAWGGCAEAMQLFRQLKKANAIMTLEASIKSSANAEEIVLASKKHFQAIKEYQKTCYLHKGHHSKHVPSSKHFIQTKSEILIPLEELDKMTRPKIGMGLPTRGNFGEAGYYELVEYDKIIGTFVSENERLPTSIGKIHYDAKGGYHVVPAHPDIYKFKRLK